MIRTRRIPLAVGLAVVLGTSAARGEQVRIDLPIAVPERPFLLVEAPRRYLPTEIAHVRVMFAAEAELEVALFRVREPLALLAQGPARQGLSVAQTTLGRESEELLAGPGPLPRVGNALELLAEQRARLRLRAARRRLARAEESLAYDSYVEEESDVQTWGVSSGRWADETIALGRLPSGLYLVRVMHGSWAASALLSVGENVLLVRRGDAHDEVRVLGPDGAPRASVAVEARDGASVLAAGTTDANGALRLPASDRPALRYVARSGDDVAWTDVGHARMGACDPRVYLATGRPVYRPGEIVHVRGHVRGCGPDGRSSEAALADEPVALWSDDERAAIEVRSDADGNFVAQLPAPADGVLHARVRGRQTVRDVQIDARQLPARALEVRLDRSWAVGGDRVRVMVADEDGGWPREARVQVRTPAGVLRGSIGPARPFVASFTMPPSAAVLESAEVVATLPSPGRVLTARAALWTGRHAEVVQLTTERAHGASGQTCPVRVAVSDLAGTPRPGPVEVAVRGGDGNRPIGPPRWQQLGMAGEDGALALQVPLLGPGPWWMEARRGPSAASLVVRDRPGPPPLSRRGELAVQPLRERVPPGGTVELDLRLPAEGAAWVTLEQGSVWSSVLVRGGGRTRVSLPVPDEARGMASVVVTHVRGAEVRTTSAAVEVSTTRPFTMSASVERRSVPEGGSVRLALQAREPGDRPRDAVVSVWMADAGYWELGPERMPAPDDYFRLPGRPASAGDGTRPVAYGAEEGRFVDASMQWNGLPVEQTSFRHAWRHGGALVRMQAHGLLGEVVQSLARAAGLRGAAVCAPASRALGTVSLRVRDLPWDLVAIRVHERAREAIGSGAVGVEPPYVERGVLRFDCSDGTGSAHGTGLGLGMGTAGHGGGGAGHGRGQVGAREERLEGTLFFAGLERLGPDGRIEIEIPMPPRPGRWRIEALAIAEDGAGASAHAVVQTVRPLVASVQAPARLRVGDESEAQVEVAAPTLAGREIELAIETAGGIAVAGPVGSVRLDARGRAALPLRVRAIGEGPAAIAVRAASETAEDAVRMAIAVAPSAVTQPVALRSVVGPSATEVTLPLPPLETEATLRVRIGSDVGAAIRDELEALRAPRWNLAALRIDRLEGLGALRRAVDALAARAGLAAEIDRAIDGEVAALVEDLAADAGGDGSVSLWRGLGRSPAMTARLVHGACGRRSARSQHALDEAVEALRRAADAGRTSASEAPLIAAALACAGDRDRARALLRRAALAELDELSWAVRAAHAIGEPTEPYAARLERALDARLETASPLDTACRGPWTACLARAGERSALARAAEALLLARGEAGRDRAARVALRIAERPAETAWWQRGDREADVLALVARLDGAASERGQAIVLRGGTELARFDGEAVVRVPPGEGMLVLRLERAPGRFSTVRIDGQIAARPEHAGAGSVPFERRFVEDDGERWLELAFALRREARALAIDVPLPAGLDLDGPAGAPRVAVRASGRSEWIWTGDPDAGPSSPRLVPTDDGLVLRWASLASGRYVVRVPVAATARGSFTAAAALLRTADGTQWALAPPLAVSL